MPTKSKPDWDRPPRRPPASAKIKNLSWEDQEVIYLLRNPTDETVPQQTIEECMVYLLNEHDLTCAASTFSDWESGFALELRNRAARETALEAMEEEKAKNPNISLEELEKKGRLIFTAETIKNKDVLNFTRLGKWSEAEKARKQKDKEIAQKDRLLAQKDELLAQNDRKIQLLETKAARLDAMEAKAKEMKAAGGLSPEILQIIEKELKLL